MRNFTKIMLSLAMAFGLLGGVNSVSADPVITKTPILLKGGKFLECYTPGTYVVRMDGYQSFLAYDDATGVAFNEDSYMQFNMAESCSNGAVRVTFKFSDNSTQEVWWCLGIGESKDDPNIPYNHVFDNSKYWLKKGLSSVWNAKKDLNIIQVKVQNFNVDNSVYKINGGTICGEPLTVKTEGQWWDPTSVGAYGGVFSATAAQTNIFQLNNLDVSDYQKIVIKFGEAVPTTGGWNLYNGSLIELTGKTQYEFDLNGTAISDFTIFNMAANPDPISISEVYFYKEVNDVEASPIYEAPAGTIDLKNLTGTNTGWSSSVKYSTELGGGTALCGDGNGDAESTHVTITGKDYICFEVTDVKSGGLQLRTWVWDGEVKTFYAYPIANYATATWGTPYTISTPGTYVVKISGYDKLKGVKTYWGEASITISQAWLNTGDAPVDYTSSGKYALSGASSLSASVTAALADADATYYDATAIVGTGVDLTSVANPNALFKATAGQLSNTDNVIISDVCASLVLEDGHPFKAPSNFTATASSYGRAFTADKITTVCLPFALTSTEAATLGAFYELSSFDGATLHFSAVAAPEANKAYLVKTDDTDLTLSEANKSIVATPSDLSTAITDVDFIGTLASTTIPASDGTNSYYAYNNGALVRIVTTAATLPAFRGYFKISTSAITTSARELTLSFDDDVTGISQIETTRIVDNADAFDLQGRRVAQPTKGLYIVNGKKVIIK